MSKARIAIAALALSAAGFVSLILPEGYTGNAIIPTKGDVPTIGFGTTEGVRMGDKITPVRAVERAYLDVKKYEGAMKRCVEVPLHQEEYDLYLRLSYNIGSTNFCTNPKMGGPSTLVKRLNAGDYLGACDAILLYKYAAGFDCSTPGNKRCAGVWDDRIKTHKRCMEVQ